jgi:hypothetical protein
MEMNVKLMCNKEYDGTVNEMMFYWVCLSERLKYNDGFLVAVMR